MGKFNLGYRKPLLARRIMHIRINNRAWMHEQMKTIKLPIEAVVSKSLLSTRRKGI